MHIFEPNGSNPFSKRSFIDWRRPWKGNKASGLPPCPMMLSKCQPPIRARLVPQFDLLSSTRAELRVTITLSPLVIPPRTLPPPCLVSTFLRWTASAFLLLAIGHSACRKNSTTVCRTDPDLDR